MTRTLCVALRRWSIDRQCRRRPALRGKPLALVEVVAQRRLVVHVSPEVPPAVRAGMTLAEARAHCVDLIDLPTTPRDDARALEALARWLVRFSPSVAISPPDTIFLEATGLDRLYGGLDNLHRRVSAALARLGITATIAIAPTPGAAYAIATFGGPPIVEPDAVESILASLPPEALRLDVQTITTLNALGIATIAALCRIPRTSLKARFGPLLLQRLDQAFGALHEPLTFFEHRSPIRATVEFEGVVESLDALYMALDELVARIVKQLARRGLGARRLHVAFGQPYAVPIEKTVELTRASRAVVDLVKLLRCALETLKLDGDGFLSVTLAVPVTERLHGDQDVLIGGERERNTKETDRLVERLQARMDRAAVGPVGLVPSHAPERAFMHGADAGVRTATVHPAAPPRPMRLFTSPREVRVTVTPSDRRDGWPVSFTDAGQVHRLAHVRGPERIAGEWWRGRDKTRDYFDAIDAEGGRYWLFRVAENSRWFLHGVFE